MPSFKSAAITAALSLLALPATRSQFVSVSGTKILDASGNELFFSGINLGNWLVWEGYLMMGDFNYRTHTGFFNSLSDALGGDDKAAEFEYQWRLNYVDERAIADLRGLGFNSVRVPFNFKLFYRDGVIVDDGFEFFDRVIDYCRVHDMYVLLDMHGAPGYQNPGDHSDNVDSNANQPRDTVKFWDGNANIQLAAAIWRHIATYYKDEPVVWGYDLINEPVPQDGQEYELLPSYVSMRNAIREVDGNHIIVAEGSWWGSDLTKIDWSDPNVQQQTGITSAWDSKLVYQIHHYGPASATYGREQITQNLGIPIFIGEYGETDEGNLLAITDWAKQALEGYFPWSFKKMSHDRCLWTIPPTGAYDQVKAYINNGGGTPPTHLYDDMISFAQVNTKNGHNSHVWHQGFYIAIKPSITCAEASSFDVPGTIQAEEYCEHFGTQLENTSDEGGGQNIGWLDPGDYTEYNIAVGIGSQYLFEARVASAGDSGQMNAKVDGNSVAVFNVPNTGGWQSWTTMTAQISLSVGTHRLRLDFPGGSFNVNWVKLTTLSTGPPTTSPTSHPTSDLQSCLALNDELRAQIVLLEQRLAQYETPTMNPTSHQTTPPTTTPTQSPTLPPNLFGHPPSGSPTSSPIPSPTVGPTAAPSSSPTDHPTRAPTSNPTDPMSSAPSLSPTRAPTHTPTTGNPTVSPTPGPTAPTNNPLDCNSAPSFAVPGQFEAEQYCDQQGVEIQEGHLAQISNGDYVEYNIVVAAGSQYTFAAHVISPVYSGQINLQLNGGSVLWLSVPHTNGAWSTIWANVWLNPGSYRLRVAFPQGGFEVDWMAFNTGTNNPP